MTDDIATQCGAYIKHRMPELSDAEARDAATCALDWLRTRAKNLDSQREIDMLEDIFGPIETDTV